MAKALKSNLALEVMKEVRYIKFIVVAEETATLLIKPEIIVFHSYV